MTDKKDKPVDLTDEREERVVPVAQKILEVMLLAEFKLEDWDYLVLKVKASIDMAVNAAEKHLFGKEIFNLTLGDIDKVLKQIKKHD